MLTHVNELVEYVKATSDNGWIILTGAGLAIGGIIFAGHEAGSGVHKFKLAQQVSRSASDLRDSLARRFKEVHNLPTS